MIRARTRAKGRVTRTSAPRWEGAGVRLIHIGKLLAASSSHAFPSSPRSTSARSPIRSEPCGLGREVARSTPHHRYMRASAWTCDYPVFLESANVGRASFHDLFLYAPPRVAPERCGGPGLDYAALCL
jgi:hypothetical protein